MPVPLRPGTPEKRIMIQVLERAAKIIDELALDGDVPLESMVRLHNLNKGTLCNILRTLIELKWVEKSGRGSYRLSEHFKELCNTPKWDKRGIELMQNTVMDLSRELRESVVVSTLHHHRLMVVVQAQYQRELMINQVIYYARLSLFTSVSGRVICAFLPPEERRAIYSLCDADPTEPNRPGSFEEFEAVLSEVRQTGASIMTNRHLGIKSFAVPVLDANGSVCASLGLTMPLSRLPEDGGDGIMAELRRANKRLMRQLALGGFAAGDFLR